MGVAEKLKWICKNSCFLLDLLNKYDFQARNYKEKVQTPSKKKKGVHQFQPKFQFFCMFHCISKFFRISNFPSQSSLPIIFEHYKLVCR